MVKHRRGTYRVVAMKLSRGDGVALIGPVNAPNFLHKETISPDLQLETTNFRKILENVLFTAPGKENGPSYQIRCKRLPPCTSPLSVASY
jgi:hypothetical protein